jgi:hypothetical protein
MPWLSETPSQEQHKETERIDDDQALEATSSDHLHIKGVEDEENSSRKTSTSNDQDESIEIIEDSEPVATLPNEDSQVSIYMLSLPFVNCVNDTGKQILSNGKGY